MPQRWIPFWLCLLAVVPAVRAQAPQAAAQTILAEINRLKTGLPSLKLSAAEQENFALVLSRSERAAHAGHLLFSLHQLQAVAPTLGGYRLMHSAPPPSGLSAFEQQWRRAGPVLAARQRRFSVAQRLPLAVRALIERALTQVQPNYQASLLYAREASVNEGLYYLGLAQAQLDFAAFLLQLKWQPAFAAPLPAPAASLAEMEKDVLEAYRQFDTPEQHSAFIRVNSALKLAQDMTRERRASGVWLQVFEARRALVPILTSATASPDAATLRAQSAKAQTQLSQSNADQSLGWLYWQMAEALLATDELKQAQVVLQHVLPRYFNALTRNKS